jgi:hypothetical protein
MSSIERETGAAPALAETAAVCARVFGEVFDRELVAETLLVSAGSTVSVG